LNFAIISRKLESYVQGTGQMTIEGILSMIVILALIWGGFAFALAKALKNEKRKMRANGSA